MGIQKLLKVKKQGYNTYILHLAPASTSGHNTCPKATEGCKIACLNTAGRGGMFKIGETTNTIQIARIRKTKLFFNDRIGFLTLLVKDIELAIKQSIRLNLIPTFRLNGTSDICFEKYPVIRNGVKFSHIFEAYPELVFYDYTKILGRKVSNIENYSLTFSAADGNDSDVIEAIKQGYNIATVFGLKKTVTMPKIYNGIPVFNGDESDLRFLGSKNVIVGLYAKGKAKKDNSGFVKYL